MHTQRDFFEMLDESQWWPREKMVAWQRQQLHVLLDHARSTTPFYKFRLNQVFRPNGTIDWDRWQQIPIVTRGDVLEHFDAMLSRAPIAQHGWTHDGQSSGSTGHPVKVRTTKWQFETSAACNWRAHQWGAVDWSKNVLYLMDVDKRKSAGDSLGPWGPPWLKSAQQGQKIYVPYGNPMTERLQLVEDKGVSYHATPAPSAAWMEEFARSNAIHVHLDKFLLRSGAVTDQLHADLRDTFGADVLEFYSSKECGAMAVRCPFGHGYHVNAELVLLEVVDPDGLPVAPGVAGRAVITAFGSTAFPLIRYDQGDIVIAGTTCECGRPLPVIDSISGREQSFFRHPDGRRMVLGLDQEGRELIGAGLVQIAQIGPTDYEVRYTPRNWGVARDEARFIEKFEKAFFGDATVTLVQVPEIPLSSRGKFLSSVIEWQAGEPT